MLAEYKAFLFRGNLLDLATAVILGGAFGAVVAALANDVIMGTIARQLDLASLAELTLGPVLVGTFIAALLTFVIIALVMFFVLRAASRFIPPPDAEPGPDSDEVVLLREIRDLLLAQQRG